MSCLGDRYREQARSHIGMHSPVGASLLAKAILMAQIHPRRQ